ncbi:MAG: DUF998 domain-containing protein [Frankiales bacterium]|nr:MAG: DUF998 domain-containing protein [Frankiales bacterium]
MPIPRTVAAACGIVAPLAFVGAWLVGGLVTDGYDPLADAISRLAREGAPTRALMTTGFVVFGLLLPMWAVRLGRELGSSAVRNAAVVAGLATLGVALLPLTREGGQPQDVGHAVAAGIGYAAMALTPLLAVGPLRRIGQDRAAGTSLVVGALSALALVGTVLVVDRGGGLQRLGLTVVDLWHVAAATWVLRRRPAGSTRAQDPGLVTRG